MEKMVLHVFYDIWKAAMIAYQMAVRDAIASFFSNLILNNYSDPRILFKVIDSITPPPPLSFYRRLTRDV